MDLRVNFFDRFLRTQKVFGPDSGVNAALTYRSPLAPTSWFVDPQNGSANADGRDPRLALSTVAAALALMKAGDVLFVVGNITEEVTVGPGLEDISIIGVSNRPRHADHARDNTFSGSNQGCSWRQAASHGATTPLLKIRAQGVHIENILFVPPSDAAAIYLDRNALSGTSEYDASHAAIVNCRLVGGQSGIEDAAGTTDVFIKGCIFQSSTDGIKSLGTAVDIANHWEVRDNIFVGNTHNIRVSAYKWLLWGNVFGEVGSAPNISLTFIAGNDAGEVLNVITRNHLAGTYNNTNYIEGGGNTDEWGGNSNVIAGGWTAAQP